MIRTFTFIVFIFVGVTGLCFAQPRITPRLTGVAGAGTSISTGLEASFTNPANLMIRNHGQGVLMYLPQFSYFQSDGFSAQPVITDYPIYLRSFTPFNHRWPTEPYASDLNYFLNNTYRTDVTLSNSMASFDGIVFGFSVTKPTIAYSLAYRLRGENNWKIGNGWYSNELGLVDVSLRMNDYSLQQKISVFHEFALGLAWEYELISGWLTDLSKLFIGINPKVILGGMYFENNITARYEQTPDGVRYMGELQFRSAGVSSDLAERIRNGAPPVPTIRELLDPQSIFDITGIGGGVDAGITYIMGIGDELSLGSNRKDPTYRSVRFSAAITDLGIISYHKKALRLQHIQSKHSDTPIPSTSERFFTGAPGQYFDFLSENDDSNELLQQAVPGDDRPINLQLPTKFSVGTALQLNRILFSADMQMPLSNDPFFGNTQSWHLGTEIKLLRLLPIRGGVRLQKDQPIYAMAGVGLDFRAIDISAATQVKVSESPGIRPVGVSSLSVQLRF